MEYRTRHILDGEYHKLVISQAGEQTKIVLGRTDEMSVIGAQQCAEEVRELLEANYRIDFLKRMHQLIDDKNQLGEKRNILRYSKKSIEIVMKIVFPEEYLEWKNLKHLEHTEKTERFSILNIGCTSSGKTLFDIKCILDDDSSKNFLPALTSIKESTNFMISYHVNSINFTPSDGNDFRVIVQIKTEQTLNKNIEMQILEAVVEMYDSIKEVAKDENSTIEEIRKISRLAAVERLKINKDKTFVIGYMIDFESYGTIIEKILINGIREYYGQSSSYDRVGFEKVYEGLVTDIREKRVEIDGDDISNIVYRNNNKSEEYFEIFNYIKNNLDKLINQFQQDHNNQFELGKILQIDGESKLSETKDLVDQIFGNKRRQGNMGFYSIEALIENAELYFVSSKLSEHKELVLVDGLGINQGQASSGNELEIAFNRVQASIQESKPDIILYHSVLSGKDDYMIEVVKMLSEQGYGHKTYVVFGRLDSVAMEYFEQDEISLNEVISEDFEEFINYVEEQYLKKDTLSLNSIIGENYYLCDKMGTFNKKIMIEAAKEYDSNSVLKKIMMNVANYVEQQVKITDMNKFFDVMDRNFVFGKTYIRFLANLDNMIPPKYEMMRWNVLEKALDELYASRWGFNSLFPSIVLKRCMAEEINTEKVRMELLDIFGEKYDYLLKMFLQEWTDVAHIVMVIAYKSMFYKLLRMRFDSNLRTVYGVSMTTDRKINLKNLYERCFRIDGMDGMETLRLIAQITWKNKF